MDGFTLNLLLYIYNDIYMMKQIKGEEQKDIYSFMYFIKEKKCNCADIFDDDYFDFIKYVMEKANPDKNNGDKNFDDVFYCYCNNHTYRDRWNFMVKYWSRYRLEKAKISIDSWNVFCEHLDISVDDGNKGIASRWCHNAAMDKRYILNKLLDQLCNSNKKSIEEFLQNIDIENLLNEICGTVNGIDSLNFVYARLLEEKIKANIYIHEQGNDKTCKEKLNKESQLRYLLYMAGYYDSDDNYNANGSYDIFKKYLDLHEQIREQIYKPSIQWRKAYYMSAINLKVTPLRPSDNTQCWHEDIRLWKGKSIPRDELNRVKNIFDALINNNWTLDDMISDYQVKCCDISCWLYYLLRRDMVELINGSIYEKNGPGSGYSYSGHDYFEYVFEKDLIAKGYVVPNRNMPKKQKHTSPISPRKGIDEQTRNRNPVFIISPYFEKLPTNTIINQNICYKFEFWDFDPQNNNEDRFNWWEDKVFLNTISAAYNKVIDAVCAEIDLLSEDEICDIIYQKETDRLKMKLNNMTMNAGWAIDSIVNEGANGVKIRIKCTELPFTNSQPIIREHSAI